MKTSVAVDLTKKQVLQILKEYSSEANVRELKELLEIVLSDLREWDGKSVERVWKNLSLEAQEEYTYLKEREL